MLYDVKTRKQSQLFDQPSGCPSWSSDGESLLFVFFWRRGEWCFRMGMRDRRIERIANLKEMGSPAGGLRPPQSTHSSP
jgi:hypothetical protein